MWTDFALTSAIPAFILLWNAARSGEWFFAVTLPAATDSTGQAPVPWFMLNLVCGCQNYYQKTGRKEGKILLPQGCGQLSVETGVVEMRKSQSEAAHK